MGILFVIWLNIELASFSLDYLPLFVASSVGIYWLGEGFYGKTEKGGTA